MEWLAGQLRDLGRRCGCIIPISYTDWGRCLCAKCGGATAVDVIYRFWELFDIANISIADFLLQARREDQLTVTPPMRPFQEEKLNLALFHHHLLAAFWRETLPKASHAVLRRIIPKTWVMDATALPPERFWTGQLSMASRCMIGEILPRPANVSVTISSK